MGDQVLIGTRFDRWVVLAKAMQQRGAWLCQCDCGTRREVRGAYLLKGRSRSCGCLRIDTIKITSRIHGLAGTPTYAVYSKMRQRCYNERDPKYPLYGARGITVCPRWRESFSNFVADMGLRPPELTLDRINNDGNYEPGNCRWATRVTQARNSRQARNITINGRTQCIAAWCEELGMPPRTVECRIHTGGWSPERAITTPIDRRRSGKRERS